jgi:hypothetical protein
MTLTYVDTGGNTQSTFNSFGFEVLPEPPQAGVNIAPTGGLGVSPGVSAGVSPSNNTGLPLAIPHSHSHSHFHSHSPNNIKNGNSASGVTVSASYTTTDTSPKTISINTANNAVHLLSAVYKVTSANHNSNTASMSFTHLAAVTNSSSNNNNVMKNNILQQNTTSPNSVAVASHTSHQNNTSLILTALSVQDMKFHITNFNDTPITDLVVSISSRSGNVKIVGDDLWTVPIIPPHTTREFSTKVYASTSLIASPVSFKVIPKKLEHFLPLY